LVLLTNGNKYFKNHCFIHPLQVFPKNKSALSSLAGLPEKEKSPFLVLSEGKVRLPHQPNGLNETVSLNLKEMKSYQLQPLVKPSLKSPRSTPTAVRIFI